MRMKKLAVVLLVPSLLFGVGAIASAETNEAPPVNSQTATTKPYGDSLLDTLSSLLTDAEPNQPQRKENCWSPMLYSQHDVVGDPEACFKGRYMFGNGSTAAPALP